MGAIFLSASVPLVGRGTYHETSNPFLIQCAVRELVLAVIRDQKIVWGGHPAITPMISSICQDLNIEYSQSVILYQSRFFEREFPEENNHFGNVHLIEAVPNDREASLFQMREAMLSRQDLKSAVFIGGMEGVEIEHKMFSTFHPNALVLPVPAPGGAALRLAEQLGTFGEAELRDIDFARLFRAKICV